MLLFTYTKSHINLFPNEVTSCLTLCREIVYNNFIPRNTIYQNLYALLNGSLSNSVTQGYQSTD